MESALITKVETGLVAMQEGELGRGGQVTESLGDAGEFVGGVELLDAVIEKPGLDGPGAAHAPIGGGHFLDHAEFDSIAGSEALDVLGQEVFKALPGFVAENDAIGEQAVAGGVGGGAAPAFRGGGSQRFRAVGAGRENFSK